MRSCWVVQVALNPRIGVFIRSRRDTDTEEKPHEDGGREGTDVATSPGTPAAPEAGGGAMMLP